MHYDWQACFKLVQLGMHCSAAHKRLFAIIKRATGSERRLGYFTKFGLSVRKVNADIVYNSWACLTIKCSILYKHEVCVVPPLVQVRYYLGAAHFCILSAPIVMGRLLVAF